MDPVESPTADEGFSRMLSLTYGGPEIAEFLRKKLCEPPRHSAIRINTVHTSCEEVLEALHHIIAEWADERGLSRPYPEPTVHPLLPDTVTVPCTPPSPTLLPSASFSPPWRISTDFAVVVDRICGEAVLRGADVFARGILSCGWAVEPGCEIHVFVDLRHKTNVTRALRISRYIAEFKDQYMYIGNGISTMDKKTIFAVNKGLAIRMMRRVHGEALAMNGILPGLVFCQNLPCIVAGHVLAPQPGDMVLDMCASPGGKTTHLATLLRNTGTVIACDRTYRKSQAVVNVCKELHITNVVVVVTDSRRIVLKGEQFKEKENISPLEVVSTTTGRCWNAREIEKQTDYLPRIKGWLPESFDRILLDAPCSALGLRPRLCTKYDPKDVASCASVQRDMLWCAATLLKKGGTLLYSTCTLTGEENEANVRWMLDKFENFRLTPAEPRVKGAGPGLPGFGLSDEERYMVQRFYPDQSDTIGFFLARFEKSHIASGSGSIK
eukprot:440716_1